MKFFLALFFAWGVLAGTGPEAPDASSTSPPPSSASAIVVPYQFSEDSEMTVHGSSNVRDWTMDVQELTGEVDLQPAEEGAPTVNSVQLQVPVDQIVADRGSMQDKAHKALQKNAYPTIYFQSDEVEVTPAEADSFSVTATGELIIAGERRTVDLQATGTRQDDGTYRLEGEHEMTLSEFNIDRPTAMFGALQVADEIRLTFSAILAPK